MAAGAREASQSPVGPADLVVEWPVCRVSAAMFAISSPAPARTQVGWVAVSPIIVSPS
jgi:hypothetical protein